MSHWDEEFEKGNHTPTKSMDLGSYESDEPYQVVFKHTQTIWDVVVNQGDENKVVVHEATDTFTVEYGTRMDFLLAASRFDDSVDYSLPDDK